MQTDTLPAKTDGTCICEPFAASFAARRQALFTHLIESPPPSSPTKAIFYEIARLAAGDSPSEDRICAVLDFIDARQDCADFALHGVLRLLLQFGDLEVLDRDLIERIDETILDFKYWPDEIAQPVVNPAPDTHRRQPDSMCTWTENHQILFSSAAYLAGQHYPDAIFTQTGVTGREKMARHRPRILRWLDLRFRTGFSEWLSHVYYDEDLTALLSLIDFCEDNEIRQRATMVVDLLLFDIVLNSFRGVFGSTHGRSYADPKRWVNHENTIDTVNLLFGAGIFTTNGNMSSVPFALSDYEMPRVLAGIVEQDRRPVMRNRQRMGLRVDEGARWDLGYDDVEDGMVWLSMEAYFHPRLIELTLRMFDAFNWWDNDFFRPAARYRRWLERLGAWHQLPRLARLFQWDIGRNTREEVNILTYKTPDYMLSTAQDYRAGYGGDQQHIWQATLGPDAVCFTTHPARLQGKPPNLWAGSGVLPRVAQMDNVVLAIYSVHRRPALYISERQAFTHAWLPKKEFDEVREVEGWVFARKDEGYLALRSQRPARWRQSNGASSDRELLAPGRRNIWICELGRRADNGPFEAFIAAIANASLTFRGRRVTYTSPSQGRLEFGWMTPLRQNGRAVALHGYPRYDNPYAYALFPMDTLSIRFGSESLVLDWERAQRTVSHTIAEGGS